MRVQGDQRCLSLPSSLCVDESLPVSRFVNVSRLFSPFPPLFLSHQINQYFLMSYLMNQ